MLAKHLDDENFILKNASLIRGLINKEDRKLINCIIHFAKTIENRTTCALINCEGEN